MMSRQQATKAKGSNRAGASLAPVVVPVVNSDIVPGRITVTGWGKICLADDDHEFITSLVEEILEVTVEKCYNAYISKKVLPYAVFKAKEDLLKIIQWRFLSHDSGEKDIELNEAWTEDAEPKPCIIDSWAQGSVPIVTKKNVEPILRPVAEEEPDNLEVERQCLDDLLETISSETGFAANGIVEVSKPELKAPPHLHVQKAEKEAKQQKLKPMKKNFKCKKQTGKLPLTDVDLAFENGETQLLARGISDLSLKKESGAHLTLSQRSFDKLQAGRLPHNKDTSSDERENAAAVMTLDPKRLPTHKVRVTYSIVDPEAEAATQRLEAMRTGKLKQLAQIHWKPKPRRTRISPRPSEKEHAVDTKTFYSTPSLPRRNAQLAGRFRSNLSQNKARSLIHSRQLPRPCRKDDGDFNIEPLPPPIIDSIDVSPGVVMTEGEQVKGGARKLKPLVQAPVLSEDGTIIGSVSVSTRGGRTLRFLGAPTASSSESIPSIRPILSPSRIIGCSEPRVSSPISVLLSVVTPQTSSSFANWK